MIACLLMQELHQSMFLPALPAPKQDAIERLGMGVVDKLFIRFHSGKQPAADSESAADTSAGRNILSQKLFWKVGSTVGNAGFLPTEHRAPDSSTAAQPVAARSVLSHQLLWKVSMTAGPRCLSFFVLSFSHASPSGHHGCAYCARAGDFTVSCVVRPIPTCALAACEINIERVAQLMLHAMQVDADDKYWDAKSDPLTSETSKGSSPSRRPWWQGSYSLRIWGPEFLPNRAGVFLPHAIDCLDRAAFSQSTRPLLSICVSTVRLTADVCAVSGQEAQVQTSTNGQAVLAGGQSARVEAASANTLILDGTLNAEGRGGAEQTLPSSLQEIADGEPCRFLPLQTLTPISRFPVFDQSPSHEAELHLQAYCDPYRSMMEFA